MSEKNAVTTTGTTAVQTQTAGSNYISMILEDLRRGFIEANDGMELDFVHVGDWLKISKKGNFVERDDETVNYGDTIDVVIGQGEQRWSLFGAEDSPEDGQLIVAEKTEEAAKIALQAWLDENPQATERYTLDDIRLRYMAAIVPVRFLGQDESPKVYLIGLSPTDTIAFGKFAYGIYKGTQTSKAVGIPAKTAVNRIVIRLETEEKTGAKNASQQWIGLKFSPLGLFNPSDYGIQVDSES